MAQAHASRRLAVLVSVVTALACCALSGCASYPSVEEALGNTSAARTLSDGATLEAGVLTVGVNAYNAPYAWATSSDDPSTLTGVDVDTALALADQLGLTVRFVNVGSNYDAAARSVCDVVMGVTANQLPGTEVLEGNYLESAPAIFAKNSTAVPTADELNASLVGVQTDSASARALSAAAPSAQLVSYATLNDAFAALDAGAVAYVACDSFMGGYLATGYASINLVGGLALPESRGVAVSATNVELQSAILSALDAISTNGIQQAIRHSWVGSLSYITVNNLVAADTAAEAAAEGEGEPAAIEGEAAVEGEAAPAA
jgi:polar amino acid transport system substrate-binding protein